MKQQRDDDDAPTVRDYLFAVGSPLAFLHFIRIPGYFILQYLCWWNRSGAEVADERVGFHRIKALFSSCRAISRI